MKSITLRYSQNFCLLLSLIFLASCAKDDLLAPQIETRMSNNGSSSSISKRETFMFGLSSDNELLGYSARTPVKEISAVAISGLNAGEKIMAIDFRPATGQLYGVSNLNKLYLLNTNTGAAVAISTTPFTPAINGQVVGFDFNPTVDRIRLVTENEQNLRLHPETGAVVFVDGAINPGDNNISAVAYTNSFAGSTTTTLYDIDFVADRLYKQIPPNNGGLELVGQLGIGVPGEGGFDISPDNKVAIAVLAGGDKFEGGPGFSVDKPFSRFYHINLTTGKATSVGTTSRQILGIAIKSNPVAYAVDRDQQLLIFNPDRQGDVITKSVTGLVAGEKIVGMDMRPATGQLYALGQTSRLYTINTASGAATVVGGQPFSQHLNGNWFGFDFNPTVDRIRIVSNTGQNLRAHPVTGDIVVVDGQLNPGTPSVSAAAYTQNFPGATSTTLYVIDYQTNQLFTQVPPNNGTLNLVNALGRDIIENNGFDIGGVTGKAMGIFSTDQESFLCEVDLASGQLIPVSSFSDEVVGFALGLGY